MATQLKNIISFTAVGAGAQQTVAHGLNIDGRGVVPDKLEFDNGSFSFVSADATSVTIQNDGAVPDNCNVMCEHWNSVERTFGPVSVTTLVPQPFVVATGGGGGGGGTADALATTGADVDVSGAAPPVAGQVLKATDATHASWLADSGVSNPLILKTGNGTVTAPVAYASAAIGHGVNGDVGTADVQVDPAASGFALGRTDSYAGGTAQIRAGGGFAGGPGTFAHGFCQLGGVATSQIYAREPGSAAFGRTYAVDADAIIKSRGFGALAFGQVFGYYGYKGYIYSDGIGGIAGGDAYPSTFGLSQIRNMGTGGIAMGWAGGGQVKNRATGGIAFGVAYQNDSSIYVGTNSDGSMATGYAENGGIVEAFGKGSRAMGHADGAGSGVVTADEGAFAIGESLQGGYITADGEGSFAGGWAYQGTIRARYSGSLAFGWSTYDANSYIWGADRGAVAMGAAFIGGEVVARESGSFALGLSAYANSKVSAEARGTLAAGYAVDGGFISGYGNGGLTVGYSNGTLSLVRTGAGSTGCWAGGDSREGARIYTRVLAKGCFSFGYSIHEGDAGTGINSRNKGAVAFGYCNCGPNQANAQVYAEGIGSFAMGHAYNNAPSGSLYSSVHASGPGSFAQGFAYGAGTIVASGDGARAGGYTTSLNAGLGVPALIEASYEGSFAHGVSRRDSDPASRAYMRAMEAGAWAGGYCWNFTAGYYSRIDADKKGSMAHGYARDGYVLGTGRGSHAFGAALYAYSSIEAGGVGAFAMGIANGAGGAAPYVVASGDGSFAGGVALNGYGVFAGGTASFAFGQAYGANVRATAQNAFQFGEGVNTTQDTVQIGAAGLRLKQTTGAPGAYQNGDIWVANNYVYIRSNGVTCKCVNASM